MKKVYKHTICQSGTEKIMLPKNSELLSCKVQHEQVSLWFLVDTSEFLTEGRLFTCLMTGDKVPNHSGIEFKFIGTCLLDSGCFVLHVFEII